MKDQINTLREALDRATRYTMLEPDAQAVQQALTALAQLEAMVGEPVAWMYRWKGRTTSEQVTRARWPESDLWIEVPLYEAAPPAQQYEAGDMASAAAQGFRDGVASVTQQPQATCKTCGRRMDDPTVFHGPNGCFPNRQPQAEAVSDDLRDRLVAISQAIADQDDRAAQAMIREILAAPQQAKAVPPDPRPVIEMCAKALAEELAAWDIDPPLHHVKEASDACEAWLAAAQGAKP